ncbi:chain length determinant protein EpsF [Sulfuriferula sp. AH1]|uniref:chain length determinant protein EpsF n=1 Tax=Sulfuriferula sp. AH1 TaxID=1985873 RepID=UPI000B3B438F|nr:chain length determinant protein EpsF [Sulfuriferula sp. AH1]ARU32524.1 chain length determinant protein EpsF [Sulfuriferula sp. AH1]
MNIISFFRVVWARKTVLLITIALTVLIAVAARLILPLRYEATASVIVDFKQPDTISGPAASTPSSDQMTSYIATQVDVLSSHNVALKVVDDLKLAQDPALHKKFVDEADGKGDIRDWIAELLLRGLSVTPSRQSNLIDVAYKSTDPESAMVIANAFVKAYIQTNLDLQTIPAMQANKWYQSQLNELRSQLIAAQKRLSDYQQSKGIVVVDERLDVESARLNDIGSQLAAAQDQTYDSTSRNRHSGDQLADVMNNPVIQSLKTDLARNQAKLDQLSKSVGVNHPDYQRARAEINTLREQIARETRNAQESVNTSMRVAQQREAALRESLAAQKQKLLALKQNRDAGAVLVQDIANAQKAYDLALQRATETRMTSQASQTNISLLNPAKIPTEPSSRSLAFVIVFALFLGTFLGLALTFIAEFLDRRIRSETDLTDVLGLPVLVTLNAIAPSKHKGLPGLSNRQRPQLN